MITLKESHFVFLMFLSFASYGIWGVLIHGMPPPILDASGGVLFFGFILFGDACLLMGEKKVFGQRRR